MIISLEVANGLQLPDISFQVGLAVTFEPRITLLRMTGRLREKPRPPQTSFSAFFEGTYGSDQTKFVF
jgi:hypothetical protein